MDRRTFLQGLAATLVAPFAGKGIFGAKTAAQLGTSALPISAPGMPSWFPMLIAKMKEKGVSKVYGQQGKGEVHNVWETERYTLLEDPMNGDVAIYGRGDDGQMFELNYTGPKKTYRENGTFTESEAEFGAYEKYKGEYQDYEMEGTFNDLKGPLDDLEAFATSGQPITQEAAEESVNKFLKNTTTEDINFAKGGRVGLKGGGNREFESSITARLPEGGMAQSVGFHPFMKNRAVQQASLDHNRTVPYSSLTGLQGNDALQNARKNALQKARQGFQETGWAPPPVNWNNQPNWYQPNWYQPKLYNEGGRVDPMAEEVVSTRITKEEWERRMRMQAQWQRESRLASIMARLRETGDISLPQYKEGLSTQGYYNSMDDVFFGGVNYNDGNKNLHIGTTIPPEGQPEWNAKFSYSFANGGPVIRPQGTLPPERGPMSNGIANLFRRTANGYR